MAKSLFHFNQRQGGGWFQGFSKYKLSQICENSISAPAQVNHTQSHPSVIWQIFKPPTGSQICIREAWVFLCLLTFHWWLVSFLSFVLPLSPILCCSFSSLSFLYLSWFVAAQVSPCDPQDSFCVPFKVTQVAYSPVSLLPCSACKDSYKNRWVLLWCFLFFTWKEKPSHSFWRTKTDDRRSPFVFFWTGPQQLWAQMSAQLDLHAIGPQGHLQSVSQFLLCPRHWWSLFTWWWYCWNMKHCEDS